MVDREWQKRPSRLPGPEKLERRDANAPRIISARERICASLAVSPVR
jgi:hypothetical protein